MNFDKLIEYLDGDNIKNIALDIVIYLFLFGSIFIICLCIISAVYLMIALLF